MLQNQSPSTMIGAQRTSPFRPTIGTRDNSGDRSVSNSASPPRLPQSNFYGGTYHKSREESPNSPPRPNMMQTKENAEKLRIVNSSKRLPAIDNPYDA